MKIKSKEGKIFEVDADFIEWFAYRFSEKGFDIKNKYAFVRGFTKNWYAKTIEKWLKEWEKEKETFLGGIFDVKLPF